MLRPVLVFSNPTSGRGRGIALSDTLTPALSRAGYTPRPHAAAPRQFDDDAVLRSAEAIVVIGGDGTLRAVVERCLELAAGDLPPVLVIGFGTANLMQRHLGLRYPRQEVAARVLELLTRRNVRFIDVAIANDRLFLLMISCGYDAGVVHALAANRRGPITKLSYVLPAIGHLRTQAYPPVTVTVDGRVVCDHLPGQVFVGNVAEYGTGIPVLTDADSADGLLDLCVLPCAGHTQFAALMLRLVRRGHRAAPGVIYTRGRDITINAADPLPVQIDGDPAGHTPVKLSLLPRRVGFIVP